MKPLRRFHLDLQDCELEGRLLPTITNLGVIVLTTGGYVLVNPSTGTAIPTSLFTTGSGGTSSIQPGNGTGIPGLAATGTAGSGGSAGATISTGSGANDATAANIPLVTRNTIANDAGNPAPSIGRPSGDRSPVLPTGQYYRGGLPETAPARPWSETPGDRPSRPSRRSPVDSPAIRPGVDLDRLASDASGHSLMKADAGRKP